MASQKIEFSNDVIRIVRDICTMAFNISSDEQLEKIFGLTQKEMEKTIEKIIAALPDPIFDDLYPRLLDEMKNICAREFIFFQVQEKCSDAHYEEDLSNFICVFCRDIQKRLDAHKNPTLNIQEE